MKTDYNQQSLKGRFQHAFTFVKKKASDIKRAYQGEVYLAWYSTRPFHIVVIEHPAIVKESLHVVNEPPSYSTATSVLRKYKPQDVIRCLDDSAQTLHEISQVASRETPRSSVEEKDMTLSYREMAGRLQRTVGNLREMQASELGAIAELH
jgi:hypothetical protein